MTDKPKPMPLADESNSRPDERDALNALAATDPAPAPRDLLNPLAGPQKSTRPPVAPPPEPVQPDAELAKRVAIARATCGCEGCMRKVPITRQGTRGAGQFGCCVLEVYVDLRARAQPGGAP